MSSTAIRLPRSIPDTGQVQDRRVRSILDAIRENLEHLSVTTTNELPADAKHNSLLVWNGRANRWLALAPPVNDQAVLQYSSGALAWLTLQLTQQTAADSGGSGGGSTDIDAWLKQQSGYSATKQQAFTHSASGAWAWVDIGLCPEDEA